MTLNVWTVNPLPADPTDAVRVYITGPSIVYGTSYQLRRVIGSLYEPMPGLFVGNEYGDGTDMLFVEDWLYPLDTTWAWQLLDAAGVSILDTSQAVGPVASHGRPWIRDIYYPSQRKASLTIVDITGRTYAGRATPYYLIADKYPVTIGDVRSASTGTMTLLCQSHAERDTTIDAMSSGSPCQLRTPCANTVDDMYFTPVDIAETRYGTRGACLLAVDFIEVSPTDLAPFKAVSYGVQTQNATTAAMNYGKLRDAFIYHTYRDMYLSQTGIAP